MQGYSLSDYIRKVCTRFRQYLKGPVIGFVLLISSLALSASLLSYSSSDPSWNTAVDAIAQNWMGPWGAIVADIFFQIWGHSSFVLAVWMLVIALRLFQGRSLSWIFFQSLVLILSCLILSLIFSQTTSFHGGAIGFILLQILVPSWWLALSFFIGLISLAFGTMSFLDFFQNKPPKDKAPLDNSDSLAKNSESIHLKISPPKPYLETRPIPKLTTLLKEYGSVKSITQKAMTAFTSTSSIPEPQPALEVLGESNLPSLDLLSTHPFSSSLPPQGLLDETAVALKRVLEEFGIRGDITQVNPGPVVTLYELKPAAGLKSARVISLADDIARSMSALSARVAIIPGRNIIGIELPNINRNPVFLKELLCHPAYESATAHLAMALGKDISGIPIITDLARMPHLLIAGTTGSGKSVGINGMILSLIYRLPPQRCKFIMIDPKMLELSVYDDIPHLLTPVVTDPKKAVLALKWTVKEMEQRYRLMAQFGVRNIENYNQKIAHARDQGIPLNRQIQVGFDPESGTPVFEKQSVGSEPLPFIVVVVDEMADLMLVAGKDIEAAVQRLAQMARAAGIHLIMATQRPSVDVITGTIKANFPTRISFQVTSKIDSRTILGEQGAEQLLGQGDMLYMAPGGRITRVHGPFVSDEEVISVVNFLKSQSSPTYIEDLIQDQDDENSTSTATPAVDDTDAALYAQAVKIVRDNKKASTSYIQRHLQIGYNRAARLIERMEAEGIISQANHVGKREVLL